VTRLSTSELRGAWAPACVGPWARVALYGGATVTVDPLVVPALLELSNVLERARYRCRPADTGAYNCRRITGGTGYSLHAFGIAVDINWSTNPYGPRLVTDMPRVMVDEILAMRTVSGKQVWGWGGDYGRNKDAMHYEIVCTPHDLASGIKGSTKIPLPEDDDMTEDQVRAVVRAELESFGSKLIASLTGSAGVKPGAVNDPKAPTIYDLRTVTRDVAAGKVP